MNSQYSTAESKKGITAAALIRLAGLFAIVGGIFYIGIQLIHPPDQLSSVNTDLWVISAGLTSIMALLILAGITGIYAGQTKESGWLGLIGFFIFSLFWLLVAILTFFEAVILPLLTSDAPGFVESYLGMFNGTSATVNMGSLPVLAGIAGILYLLGGLLMGIATVRAKVFPRMAGALLAFGAVVTLSSALIPHPMDRILAVPMGIALIWLGYILWSKRRTTDR